MPGTGSPLSFSPVLVCEESTHVDSLALSSHRLRKKAVSMLKDAGNSSPEHPHSISSRTCWNRPEINVISVIRRTKEKLTCSPTPLQWGFSSSLGLQRRSVPALEPSSCWTFLFADFPCPQVPTVNVFGGGPRGGAEVSLFGFLVPTLSFR